MDSQLARIGPIGVGRAVLAPGWRWTTSIGPLLGDASCQVHHISLVLSGRIAFQMEDGEAGEFGANTLVDPADPRDLKSTLEGATFPADAPTLYGDGKAAGRIVDALYPSRA
jgi:hypothetical protein